MVVKVELHSAVAQAEHNGLFAAVPLVHKAEVRRRLLVDVRERAVGAVQALHDLALEKAQQLELGHELMRQPFKLAERRRQRIVLPPQLVVPLVRRALPHRVYIVKGLASRSKNHARRVAEVHADGAVAQCIAQTVLFRVIEPRNDKETRRIRLQTQLAMLTINDVRQRHRHDVAVGIHRHHRLDDAVIQMCQGLAQVVLRQLHRRQWTTRHGALWLLVLELHVLHSGGEATACGLWHPHERLPAHLQQRRDGTARINRALRLTV